MSRTLTPEQKRRRQRLQRKHFIITNQATPIRLDGVAYRHDESLRPFHAMSNWDPRCDACTRAKAYVQAMTARMRDAKKSWTMVG